METNLIRYRTMAGSLPSGAQGLYALVRRPEGDPIPQRWHQLMDAGMLVDLWGHPYQYRNPGKRHPEGFDIYSLGPDGKEGTADDIYAQ